MSQQKKKLCCRLRLLYLTIINYVFIMGPLSLSPLAHAQEEAMPSLDLATRIVNTDEHQVSVKDLNDYCQTIYQTKLECPNQVCFAFFDDQGEKGFVMQCKAKTCLNLTAENCPADACRIMTGCDDEPVCYPPAKRAPPVCGDLAYDGQDVECCEGFIKRCGVEYFDGSCDMFGKHSVYGVAACIPCGNGICNQFENRCNCPEDCK